MKTGSNIRMGFVVGMAAALVFTPDAKAQTTWDGGGGTDTSWGTAANWDNDILPAFNGTDSLTVAAPSSGNTSLTLGADRSIGRITFGAWGTSLSLSGHQLRLNATGTSAGTGTALWNANTSDGVAATVNSAIRLQSGTPGSYVGHIRENVNSHGGTTFNGAITQGPGENWTLRFTQSGARGIVRLANAGNSIATLHNSMAGLFSTVPGAFGGAVLRLEGGITGTSGTAHYATPVGNAIILTIASTWESHINTRLTGSLTQGTHTLNYGSSASGVAWPLTRLEFAAVSGTGATGLRGGTVAPSAMSQFTAGTLSIADTGGPAVLVLSGAAGNDVPTWSDFVAARTYVQGGGSGTWRNNVAAGADGSAFPAGGFAARGADLTIPHQSAPNAGGLHNTVFTRNFILGSQAGLDGVRYADNAVIVATDIAYGSQTLGTRRYFGASHNAGLTKSSTQWVLAGPVHELAGVISGANIILYPMGTATHSAGIVRIGNPNNSLTGTSVWFLGGSRGAHTTLGGTAVSAPGNMGDVSNIVLVFTSDAAFGGASEVEVGSRGSAATGTSSMLLFEDISGGGATTFDRAVNVVSASETTGAAAFGSYAGNVVYTGTVTLGGTLDDVVLHVQSGAMTLGTAGNAAAIVNNRSVDAVLNKSGPGTLRVDDLDISGTRPVSRWDVRAGTLLYNESASFAGFGVFAGGTLGGTGAIALGTATLALNGTAVSRAAINPGDGLGTLTVTAGAVSFAAHADLVIELGAAADRLVVNGNLNLAALNDRLVLRRAATIYSGTYEIVRYTGSLLNRGNADTRLWQFDSVANDAGVISYAIDYGTGTNSAITLTVTGDPRGTLIIAR